MKYEDEFDKSFSDQAGGMKVKEMVSLLFYGLEAGARLSKNELELSKEDLADKLDMAEMNEAMMAALKDMGVEDPNPKP